MNKVDILFDKNEKEKSINFQEKLFKMGYKPYSSIVGTIDTIHLYYDVYVNDHNNIFFTISLDLDNKTITHKTISKSLAESAKKLGWNILFYDNMEDKKQINKTIFDAKQMYNPRKFVYEYKKFINK